MQIDMNRPDRDLQPGIDLWEIVSCQGATSKAGDSMLKIKFGRHSDMNEHLFENIMLEGRGWGIGKQKLGALVPADFNGDLDPLTLVGKRLWVETGVREYNGSESLAVNIAGDLKDCAGLQPAEKVPPGYVLPEEPTEGDTPF